jgi:hypothetical protein
MCGAGNPLLLRLRNRRGRDMIVVNVSARFWFIGRKYENLHADGRFPAKPRAPSFRHLLVQRGHRVQKDRAGDLATASR